MVLADKRLLELNGEREQLEEDLDGYEESLADRARAIYMQGDMHYLDVLFGAASFGELVDSVFFIQAIGERDEMLIDTAKQQRVELKQKLDLIETQLSEIEGIKQLLEEQRTELLSAKESKELDLRAIDQDRSLALRQIKEREETNKRIAAKMRRIQAQGTGYTGKPWAGSFDKPCAGTIKSGFGMRTHPIAKRRRMHTGVDISAPRGTAILAAGDGKVVMAERMGGYGKCVIIDHGDGRSTLYGHCSKYTCEVGDVVKKGEKIAEVGSTGYSTGNHLHFEVRINGNPVDPLKQLKQ
ncbi:peptidoglycan DD-metalloendopeptidase family protein [bacterium]|nr:peptidoglycan DD-metalloendopeptidase family protein [bacterium]